MNVWYCALETRWRGLQAELCWHLETDNNYMLTYGHLSLKGFSQLESHFPEVIWNLEISYLCVSVFFFFFP